MCTSQHIIHVGSSQNFVSSSTSNQKKCGLQNAPWLLQGQQGQHITLAITDFSWDNSSDNLGCVHSYGYILDTESDDIINICGGGHKREKQLYLSRSYSVQIVLNEYAVSNYKFLISFEG